MLAVEREKATPEVAAAMRLRKGSGGVPRARWCIWKTACPSSWKTATSTRRWCPISWRDFTQVTPSAVLFEHAPLTEAEQVVEAVVADAEQARALDVRWRPAL